MVKNTMIKIDELTKKRLNLELIKSLFKILLNNEQISRSEYNNIIKDASRILNFN